MKREGYPAGSLHGFTTNGGNTRYTLPVAAGGGAIGAVANLEGGVGGGFGGGLAKFDRHDPRQVCVAVPSSRDRVCRVAVIDMNLSAQVLISEAIAKMIVRDLQPTSMVENKGFRELLQLLEPRYTPERQHCIQSQLLPAYAYQVQLAIHQALTSAHTLSLSLDLWRGVPGAASG